MKGRLFSILLFFCFAVPVATVFVILHNQKKQVKREVKQKITDGIDRHELVLLKFTEEEKQTQLNWKHSREFEYQEEMYDIVEIEVKGDTTYYWCWWDHEETKLNKQLKEIVSLALGTNEKNHENQERLYNFFKSLYFFSEPTEVKKLAFQEMRCKQRKHFHYANLYQSLFHSPPVPPPKIG